MRIGKLAAHCCIRVQKMALPLIERGHEVHCVANKVPSFYENYTTFSLFADLGQLRSMIKLLAPRVDLFHCHNEPSWFVTLVKETTDKPVVLDVHDSFLARSTDEEAQAKQAAGEDHIRITTEERNNFQLADALVFVGGSFREVVASEFDLTQPSIVLPSYVPRFLYRYNTGPWWGGLCYEGKVVMPDAAQHGFHYCDYLDFAKETRRLGLDFHIYGGPTKKEFRELYGEIAFIHPPLEYNKLLQKVSRHDWGLVGNLTPSPEWDVALPNKLWEYLACGLPVVAMHASECAEFVQREGVGIVVSEPEELVWRWAEHRQCRANVLKKRGQWAMDEHIPRLEALYEEVLSG